MMFVKNHYKKILILLLAALAAISVIQGCRNAAEYSQDFQWDAAKVMTLHMNPYDESLNPSEELLSLGYDEYYKQMEANQFPSLLILLMPYTLLAPLTARYAWIVSNLIFTALIIFLLRKTFMKDIKADTYAVLSLLMLAGTPWRNQMGVGQHTLFAFAFFLIAVWLLELAEKYDSEKVAQKALTFSLLSGLALCVSYFKYTLTAPLALYFLYKRRYKELVISVVPHIILTAASAMWLSDSFMNMIIKPLKVAGALTSEGSMDIGSMLGGGTFTMLITVVLMAVLLVLVFFVKPGEDLLVISVLLLWSLIITYHRSYDYWVMVLPFSWLIASASASDEGTAAYGKRMLTVYIILVLGIFFGLRVFHESDVSLVVAAIFYYIYTLVVTGIAVKGIIKNEKEQ